MRFYVQLEVVIERPAADVFDFLANTENAPRWASEFARVEREDSGPIGQGTRFQIWLQPPSTLIGLLRGREEQRKKAPPAQASQWWQEYDRPRSLVAKTSPIKRGRAEVHTTQSFELEPAAAGGTHVTVTWDRDVQNVPLERLASLLMVPLITREIRRTQTEALDRLKGLVESEAAVAVDSAKPVDVTR